MEGDSVDAWRKDKYACSRIRRNWRITSFERWKNQELRWRYDDIDCGNQKLQRWFYWQRDSQRKRRLY